MPTVVSGDLVHLSNMALLRHMYCTSAPGTDFVSELLSSDHDTQFKALLDVWINCLVELTIPVDAKELRIMSPTGRGVPHVPDLCVA